MPAPTARSWGAGSSRPWWEQASPRRCGSSRRCIFGWARSTAARRPLIAGAWQTQTFKSCAARGALGLTSNEGSGRGPTAQVVEQHVHAGGIGIAARAGPAATRVLLPHDLKAAPFTGRTDELAAIDKA